jgi:hypothetical protein
MGVMGRTLAGRPGRGKRGHVESVWLAYGCRMDVSGGPALAFGQCQGAIHVPEKPSPRAKRARACGVPRLRVSISSMVAVRMAKRAGSGSATMRRGRGDRRARRGRAAIERAGACWQGVPFGRGAGAEGDPGAEADLEARVGIPDEKRRARIGGEFGRLGGGGIGVEGEGPGASVRGAENEEARLGALGPAGGEDDVAGRRRPIPHPGLERRPGGRERRGEVTHGRSSRDSRGRCGCP